MLVSPSGSFVVSSSWANVSGIIVDTVICFSASLARLFVHLLSSVRDHPAISSTEVGSGRWYVSGNQGQQPEYNARRPVDYSELEIKIST